MIADLTNQKTIKDERNWLILFLIFGKSLKSIVSGARFKKLNNAR
jgi:hypothetical protein